MACSRHCFISPPLPQLSPSPPLRLPFSQPHQRPPSSSSPLPQLQFTCLRSPPDSTSRKSPPCWKPTTSPFTLGCGSVVPRATAQESTAESALLMQDVDFTWKGEGSEVLLTGDFLGWETKLALAKGADGAFHAKQKLSPGNYRYKYIVDGKWLHSPDCPACPDGTGGLANEITVSDPLSSSLSTPGSKLSLKETGSSDTVKGSDHSNIAEDTGAGSTEPTGLPSVTVPKDPIKSVKSKAKAKEEQKKVSENTPIDVAKDSANEIKSEVKPKPVEKTSSTTAGAPAGKAVAPKPAKKVKAKTLAELISEDVIPVLKAKLEKEEAVSNVEILFEDNELEGSFTKNGVIYSFWAYFPDGKLEGSRGFSLTSHGSPPSTVEPFLIDEKKISAEMVVFWITKRLFAQNLLSLN